MYYPLNSKKKKNGEDFISQVKWTLISIMHLNFM